VLEWHVIGMFAPGFFTGHLIKRFGTLQIMGVGVVLNGLHRDRPVGRGSAPVPGGAVPAGGGLELPVHRQHHAVPAGLHPEEKDRAQAAMNFCVFATLALSSFASGALVTTQGWRLLNWGSLLPGHPDRRRAASGLH
jgi:hypothetical protein